MYVYTHKPFKQALWCQFVILKGQLEVLWRRTGWCGNQKSCCEKLGALNLCHKWVHVWVLKHIYIGRFIWTYIYVDTCTYMHTGIYVYTHMEHMYTHHIRGPSPSCLPNFACMS